MKNILSLVGNFGPAGDSADAASNPAIIGIGGSRRPPFADANLDNLLAAISRDAEIKRELPFISDQSVGSASNGVAAVANGIRTLKEGLASMGYTVGADFEKEIFSAALMIAQ